MAGLHRPFKKIMRKLHRSIKIAGERLARFVTLFVRRVRRAKPLAWGVIGGGVLLGAALTLFFALRNPRPPEEPGGLQSERQTLELDQPEPTVTPALSLPAAEDFLPPPTPQPTPTPDPTLYKDCPDSPAVTELQLRLMDLGYMDADEPTEHFGPATEAAVQLFQRQHGAQQDGIAGPVTLDLIYSAEAKKYTLLEGTEGEDVINFQQQLKDLGYLSKTTGYYGDETVKAVKSFQKINRLSEDGKAGQQTFDLINSDKAKQSPAKAAEKRKKANIDEMISAAKTKMGKRYRSGATGPDSFDCSGFVYYCLKQAGSNRRRLTAAGYAQVGDWTEIKSYGSLKTGDLLFFLNNARSKVGHVGIYIGGGTMIDASSSNGKVVRRSINTSYWKSHFVRARRPW